MTRLVIVSVICLVTLLTDGVNSQEENTFVAKGDQYPTSGQDENAIKFINPFFLIAGRDGRPKGLWGRSINAIETNEIETEKRPLFVFRPYYSSPNPQYALQPPHPDAKPIFEIRKKRDVVPESGDGKSRINLRVKRTHYKGFGGFGGGGGGGCFTCGGGGYSVAPVYTQPVYTKPVIVQPVYTKPVIAQPVYTKPVIAQPVYYGSDSGCNTCGGGGLGGFGGGGGGSYSHSQSSASSSSGSFGYGRK